jgi:DNA-binding transcriptional LysR family regulator
VREPAGTLTVAASPIVGEEFLPEVIVEYLRRFPRVRLRVELSVDFVDLRHRKVDLAIRTGPLAETTELFAVRLGASLKGLYASPKYLKRRGTPDVPADLAGHDCIVVGEDVRQSAWAFRDRGSELHVGVDGPLRVSSHRLAMAAAAAGVGIARIPSVFARPFVEASELVPVLRTFWPRMDLYAVHMVGRPAPPKIRAFIELLRGAIKRQLPEA